MGSTQNDGGRKGVRSWKIGLLASAMALGICVVGFVAWKSLSLLASEIRFASNKSLYAAHPERNPAVRAAREEALAGIPLPQGHSPDLIQAKKNAIGPVLLAGPTGGTAMPAPISITRSSLTISNQKNADPLQLAFHPSHFADPTRVVNRIGFATISLNPESATQSATALAQPAVVPTAPLTPYEEACRLENARRFVISMCIDVHGRIWIGTEEDAPGTGGVQCYDPSKPPLEAFTQYTSKDGLGDNNGYAVACDRMGRIWVGHLNHGVSVFDGKRWQNYNVVADGGHTLAGTNGERVFAIKVCPTDGDVWIATSAGLTRYSESTRQWSYFTRGEGLPSDQINALAFDASGNIYAGTQCDGIAFAKSTDGYTQWTKIEPFNSRVVPTTQDPPIAFINDLLVSHDGSIYVATTNGISFSTDRGQTWQLCRGKDWEEKLRRWKGPLPEENESSQKMCLAEDYVTSLAEDVYGTMHVGYRDHGVDTLRKGLDGALCSDGIEFDKSFVTSVVIGRCVAVGTYGEGIQATILSNRQASIDSGQNFSIESADNPPGAHAPSLAQLNYKIKEMALIQSTTQSVNPEVIPIAEDWLTEGDWLGRYGRYWALLAAMDSPYEGYRWGASPEPIQCQVELSDPIKVGDFLRFWIGSFFTDDRRALEIPPIYMHSRVLRGLTTWDKNRRLAEWDDHGEAYPSNEKGSAIDIRIQIPSGLFWLSLYEVNDDAHHGSRNSHRDFYMVIKNDNHDLLHSDEKFETAPILASARIQNFFGGVYKRFLVKGPQNLIIRINRNYSVNTIFNAIMLDLPDEHPLGYFFNADAWKAHTVHLNGEISAEVAAWGNDQKARELAFCSSDNELDAVKKIIHNYDIMKTWNPKWWAFHSRNCAMELARWAQAETIRPHNADLDAIKATTFYQLGLFAAWEKSQVSQHLTTSRQIEKSLRWDGLSRDNSGKGYAAITSQVSSKQAVVP